MGHTLKNTKEKHAALFKLRLQLRITYLKNIMLFSRREALLVLFCQTNNPKLNQVANKTDLTTRQRGRIQAIITICLSVSLIHD